MLRQRTIREKISCVGVGLHSGQRIKLELLPAPENSGITFVRTDLPPHPELRPCVEHVSDTTLATTLSVQASYGRVTVATVEHLLAALVGVGVDNIQILLDGPEVPILDGSAAPFVEQLLLAGLEQQRYPRRFLVIKKEVKIADGEKTARIMPSSQLRITCSLDFDHPLISPTPFRFDFSERSFQHDIAKARTFGFMQDVEALRKRGLARGGSLDNAIVIDNYRVLNPEGLRYHDEFVRHKVLDVIGDLALFGMPVIGWVHLHRAGHALNAKLAQTVLSEPKSFAIVQPTDANLVRTKEGETSTYDLLDALEIVA